MFPGLPAGGTAWRRDVEQRRCNLAPRERGKRTSEREKGVGLRGNWVGLIYGSNPTVMIKRKKREIK